MKRIIFGYSVQGASHKRTGLECQDSNGKLDLENASIMVVADGHGSSACPYSKTVSAIAVNAFCKVIGDLFSSYSNNLDMLMTYLNREGDTKVAQKIHSEWKKRVFAVHKKNKREIPVNIDGKTNENAVYRMYGTTLVGVLITSLFMFAFQIGDGDITYVDDDGVQQFLVSDKILGTETHSLSKDDAWKSAITTIYRNDVVEKRPSLLMLSSDGFSNSFPTEEQFCIACKEYFDMIKKYGVDAVKNNLKDWLVETSEQGCGDDITLVLGYLPPIEEEKTQCLEGETASSTDEKDSNNIIPETTID